MGLALIWSTGTQRQHEYENEYEYSNQIMSSRQKNFIAKCHVYPDNQVHGANMGPI